MCLCAHVNVDLILPCLFHQYENAQLYIKVILYTDDSPRLTCQVVSVAECDWHAGEGVTSLHDGAFEVFVAVILHSWTHRSMGEKWLPEFTVG